LAGVFFQRREVVVPGQLLAEGRYRSAIGTYHDNDRIYSALVGLAELRGNTIKVVPLEGVYIPREGDLVIGTITEVASNNWKVDIGGPYGASIHANNALRRPYDDDLSRYMDIGDVIAAEVIAFDRVTGPFLTMKGRGLRKLEGGMVLEVSPAKIPRIIGRRGSMINMVKDILRIHTVVGQNGKIWLRAPDIPTLRLAMHAFKTIEDQSHTLKLTDRIHAMLQEELKKLKGEDKPPDESPEKPIEKEEPTKVDEDIPPIEEVEEEKSEEKPVEEDKEVKDE
jgi:exosome complex component RRP4